LRASASTLTSDPTARACARTATLAMAALNLPLTARIMIGSYMRVVFAKLATLGNIDALSNPFDSAAFTEVKLLFFAFNSEIF